MKEIIKEIRTDDDGREYLYVEGITKSGKAYSTREYIPGNSENIDYTPTEEEATAELIEVQKAQTLVDIQLAQLLGEDEAITRLRSEYTTLAGGTPLPTNQEIIDMVMDPYIVADIEAAYLDETGGTL